MAHAGQSFMPKETVEQQKGNTVMNIKLQQERSIREKGTWKAGHQKKYVKTLDVKERFVDKVKS